MKMNYLLLGPVRIGGILLSIAFSCSAQAQLRTAQFAGMITNLEDPLNAFNGGIEVGNSFTAMIVYDLSNPGGSLSSSANEQRRLYQYSAPTWNEPIGLVISINGFTFDSDITDTALNRFHVEVIDRLTDSHDVFNAGSSQFTMNVNGAAQYNDLGMGLQLLGTDLTLSSADQPTDIRLSDWSGPNSMNIFGNAQGVAGFRVSGRITRVPEPTTSSLFAAVGMIGLGMGWRRRRESQRTIWPRNMTAERRGWRAEGLTPGREEA